MSTPEPPTNSEPIKTTQVIADSPTTETVIPSMGTPSTPVTLVTFTPPTVSAPTTASETPAVDTRTPEEIEDAKLPADAGLQPIPYEQNGVCVDGVVYRGRSDNDVLTGFFCDVIAGPNQGRYGVYIGTSHLDENGWPDQVTVRTRDTREDYLTVAYSDIRPAQAGRR